LAGKDNVKPKLKMMAEPCFEALPFRMNVNKRILYSSSREVAMNLQHLACILQLNSSTKGKRQKSLVSKASLSLGFTGL